MAINPKLIREFRSQSMTDKCAFIEENLHYASSRAIVKYAETYILDVLDELNDPEVVADWLRTQGYTTIPPNNTHINH